MNAVDTNVLIYLISADEPAKRAIATQLMERVDASDTVLLWQVAVEVGAVVERLAKKGMMAFADLDFVAALRERFPLVLPTENILNVSRILRRVHQVSYWDSLLLAACAEAGVTRLYSEDLQSAPALLHTV